MTEATPLASEQITQAQIIAFLNGAEPLEGLYFGDPHPSGRAFWWRKYLPALSASPAPSGQGVSGERLRNAAENLLIAIGMGWDLEGVIAETEAVLAAPAPSCAPGEVERLRAALKPFAFEGVTIPRGLDRDVLWFTDAVTGKSFTVGAVLDARAALSPQGLDAKEGGE